MTFHAIDDALLDEAQAAIKRGETWIAVNKGAYSLERGDLEFFRDREEALEFANGNYSDVE